MSFFPKPPVIKLGKAKVKPLKDSFGSEVSVEERKLTGASKKLLRAYTNPARLLPTERLGVGSLKRMAGVK